MVGVFRRSRRWLRQALARPVARADDSKRFVHLAAGEETHAWGTSVKATAPSMLVLALSRHAVTVAVLDGSILLGDRGAGSGEALVTNLETGVTRLQRFDVQLLAAALPEKWRNLASAALGRASATDIS